MYFYEVLTDIMNEKSLSIPDVAKISNLADSTIRSIISRKTKTVALEVAFKLSKGLNVSLEQLNGDEAYNTIDLSDEDSTKKKEFLEIFDNLTPELKDYLLSTGKELLSTQNKLLKTKESD